MSDLDLTKLREIAEAATPGPWEAVVSTYSSEYSDYEGAQIPGVAEDVSDYYIGTVPPLGVEDATYIAAFDPPTVIALIDEIGRLRNASEFEQRARLQFAALGVPVDEQDEWLRRIAVPAAAGLTLNEFMQLVRAFLSGVSLVDVGGEFDD